MGFVGRSRGDEESPRSQKDKQADLAVCLAVEQQDLSGPLLRGDQVEHVSGMVVRAAFVWEEELEGLYGKKWLAQFGEGWRELPHWRYEY